MEAMEDLDKLTSEALVFVIFDTLGNLMFCGAKNCNCFSSEEAELKAIKFSLEEACKRKLEKISLYYDNKECVEALNNWKLSLDWQLDTSIEDIR